MGYIQTTFTEITLDCGHKVLVETSELGKPNTLVCPDCENEED